MTWDERTAMVSAISRRAFRDHLSTLTLVLSLALFLAIAGLFWKFTIDDAYITYRYADNLARGLGPVFNDEERVEGYTSLSWMLLMAAIRLAGLDPVPASKVMGLVCGLLTLAATFNLARLVSAHRKGTAALAVLGLATHSALALNTVMGLETALYTLLLTVAVLRLLGEQEGKGWWLSTLLFALTALTRPEGIAVFGLTWLYQVLLARERWPLTLSRLALFGTIVGAHFLWRWGYYGEWLPATYYAKTGDLGPRLRAGLLYLVEFLTGTGLFLLTACLVAVRQGNERLRYILWLCGGYAAVVIWEGGDWMPGLRFWVPILPLLYVILGETLIEGYHRFRPPTRGWQKGLVWMGVGAATFLYLVLASGQTVVTRLYTDLRAEGYEKAHCSLVTWLSDHAEPDDSIALMDIGIVGYYSRLRIIDLTGLTEDHIARTPGAFQEKVYDPAYILDQEPGYVVLVSTDGDPVPDFAIDRRIYRSPQFQDQYEFLFRLAHLGDGEGPGYYLLVFERKGRL
jgi:arabinofuranosyltransferase